MKRDWNHRAKHHAQYWVATENFQNDIEFSKSGQDTANAILSRIAPFSDSSWSVLDIGCGIGRVLKPLACHFKRLVGIDVSGEMILQSKKWLDGLDNVETLETSGVDLSPFQEKSFELVYSFVAFQHMPRPVFTRYLEESHRVLKTHGFLAFQIPIGTPLDAAVEDTIAMRQYSREELIGELQRCGFQLTDNRHSGSTKHSSYPKELNGEIQLAKKLEAVIHPKNASWLQNECGQAFSLLDTRMYLWFAEQCLQEGQEDEALRTYEALREQDPLSLEKWVRTVEILVEQGKPEEAQTTLQKLTTALPIYEKLKTLRKTHTDKNKAFSLKSERSLSEPSD